MSLIKLKNKLKYNYDKGWKFNMHKSKQLSS